MADPVKAHDRAKTHTLTPRRGVHSGVTTSAQFVYEEIFYSLADFAPAVYRFAATDREATEALRAFVDEHLPDDSPDSIQKGNFIVQNMLPVAKKLLCKTAEFALANKTLLMRDDIFEEVGEKRLEQDLKLINGAIDFEVLEAKRVEEEEGAAKTKVNDHDSEAETEIIEDEDDENDAYVVA